MKLLFKYSGSLLSHSWIVSNYHNSEYYHDNHSVLVHIIPLVLVIILCTARKWNNDVATVRYGKESSREPYDDVTVWHQYF